MYDACVMRGAVVFGSDCVFQFTRGRELSFQLKGRAFKRAAVRKKKHPLRIGGLFSMGSVNNLTPHFRYFSSARVSVQRYDK